MFMCIITERLKGHSEKKIRNFLRAHVKLLRGHVMLLRAHVKLLREYVIVITCARERYYVRT